MYTMQEAFEKVSRHLFAQGCQSTKTDKDWGTLCAYRGDKNTSCAIGALIPDNEYRPEMDDFSGNTNVISIREEFNPECLKGLNGDFLLRLQSVHDVSDYWWSSYTMRHVLAVVGENYDLDTSFLKELSFPDR